MRKLWERVRRWWWCAQYGHQDVELNGSWLGLPWREEVLVEVMCVHCGRRAWREVQLGVVDMKLAS